LLTESAARRPDAEAVRLLDQALTYAELEKLSNQLAHALIEIGVVPLDRVWIYLHKSPSAIASIFGIMKTGACYVPVDPNAPGPRLAEIARQCGFRALITSFSLYEKLSAAFLDECPTEAIFFIDKFPDTALPAPAFTFADSLPSQPPTPPTVNVIDQDLAYILFTSGSTGTPKGVMLSHLNALTFVNWACDTFAISGTDRLSNHAPLNFDLAVFDIFAAIKAGAAISLVPGGIVSFPRAALLVYPESKNHRVVLCADGAHDAHPWQAALARLEPAAAGALRRRSFSDQAPAQSTPNATGAAHGQPLRADGNECLHLVRSRPNPRKSNHTDPDRQSLRQHGGDRHRRSRQARRRARGGRAALRPRLERHAGLLRAPGGIRRLFHQQPVRARPRRKTVLHGRLGNTR